MSILDHLPPFAPGVTFREFPQTVGYVIRLSNPSARDPDRRMSSLFQRYGDKRTDPEIAAMFIEHCGHHGYFTGEW